MSRDALLSREVGIAAIPAGGIDQSVVASPAEIESIAEVYGLVAVRSLSARLILSRAASGTITVEGRVEAEVVQNCVVSVEPVTQRINEPVLVRFVGGGRAGPPPDDAVVGDGDPPEVYAGDTIDFGAVALEHFVLAIDPYPRAPDATFTAPEADAEAADESPFAALSQFYAIKGQGSEQ